MKQNLRVVHKQVQKQKQKMKATLKYVAVGVVAASAITAIAFTYLNLGQTENARAGSVAAPIKDPVKLRFFEGETAGDVVTLKWRTLIEVENDHFTIERSEDGKMFEVIAVIQGAGFSDDRKDYSYIDAEPLNGTSYYRLGKTNFEGQTVYSDLITINISKEAPVKILSANVIDGLSTIKFESANKADVTVKVEDVTGKVVFSNIVKPAQGQNSYTIEDKARLSKGVYVVHIEQGNIKSNNIKLVKTE